ncbi:MAG: DUF5719 family protein [Sporichthyaceae bacterium]|nr:DUF5719 family protein [Sporichthyaceae bacterium]
MNRRPLPKQARALARQLPRPPRGMPPLRAPRSRTGRTAVLVLGALAIVFGLAVVTDPGVAETSTGEGTRVTVRNTVAVCPNPPSTGGSSRLSIAAPPATAAPDSESPASPAAEPDGSTEADGEGDRDEKAQDRATVLKQGSKPTTKSMLTIQDPGSTRSDEISVSQDKFEPLIARATGSVAPGFAASHTTRVLGDGVMSRSLSGTACPQAGTEFWFAGTGSGDNRTSWLYLVNPEDAPATVDVELFGDDGPVAAPSTLKGIVLGAHTNDRHLLQVVAPEQERLVVRVVARVGRVVAALHDQQQDGTKPHGADWIPAVTEPATRVLVPSIPGGKGERTLYLLVPGDEGALAKLKLVGKNGTFSPAPDPKAGALDTIALEGNRIKQVNLGSVANEEPFGVLIESDRPVVAALRVGTGDNPPDTAFLAATAPLGGPSIVADARNDGGLTSKLVLTAPDHQASVTIVALVAGKDPKEIDQVTIAAGTSQQISLKAVKGTFAVMITPLPGSGPVYASRVLSERRGDGDLLTIEQFQPSHTTALVPDVVNDLSAGLRPGE